MSSLLLKNNYRFYNHKSYIVTNKPVIQEPITQEPITQEPVIQEPNNDEISIISDITGNSDSSKEDLQQFKPIYLTNINLELNKLTSDNLKEKCKEYRLGPFSKLKKNELIDLLINAFAKLIDTLTNKTTNELKNICTMLEIKGGYKHKKDGLFMLVLTHCATNLIFKIDDPSNAIEETKDNYVKTKVEKERIKLEELEKERIKLEELEKERIKLEELEKERIRLEELEKERIKLEELEKERTRLEELEKERIKLEELEKEQLKMAKKEETKKKKQAIPKQIRNIVWNHYIGEDIIKHKCLSCKKVTISNINFEVGHVISEKHGGTHEINNLRPICGACNHSMGTENMVDFVVKYGLYIG
jgi:5-methylcytosine-specific restriction endonuclease McrA